MCRVPQSDFRPRWDGFIFFVLVVVAFITPFEVGFLSDIIAIDPMFALNRAIDFVFFLVGQLSL